MQASRSRPKKQQRVSQACDLCHRRSIRCRPSAENGQQQCQNCYDFAVACTFERPSRRNRRERAPQPAERSQDENSNRHHTAAHEETRRSVVPSIVAWPHQHGSDELAPAWRVFALASRESIELHLELYMDVVYPIFPLFHGPSLWDKIKRRLHLTDRGVFASVLAACALAAARAYDGAAADHLRDRARDSGESSEMFFAAARDALMVDFGRIQGLDHLRACVLLALTSMQHGQISSMHHFIGLYSALSAAQNFHQEKCWPNDLTHVDKEERRRLFWSMYTLDIYTSVVFDRFTNSQEAHAQVRYPTEVNDQDLAAGILSTTGGCWLRGWNFTTDLYRVLEHLIEHARLEKNAGQDEDGRFSVARLFVIQDRTPPQVLDHVIAQYNQLPSRFKHYGVVKTGQQELDIYGFQAANIQATMQLVRMTLFSIDASHDVDQKCAIADEVLTAFHQIDPGFLRAISTPLVYHLGGIGQMLASVTGGLLNEDSYQRVRALLVSMADLLAHLEDHLRLTSGCASKDLRSQIQKIDRYVAEERQQLSNTAPVSPQLRVEDIEEDLLEEMPSAAMDSAGGMPNLLEEFQLPQDLTHSGVWPWPFFGQRPQHLDFG